MDIEVTIRIGDRECVDEPEFGGHYIKWSIDTRQWIVLVTSTTNETSINSLFKQMLTDIEISIPKIKEELKEKLHDG